MTEDSESSIDKQIREARERGAFDNLRGKGQPIRWEDDALVPPDQRMANQILKNAGFAPQWVEESQQIDQAYQEIRRDLRLAHQARAEGRLDEPGWQAARAAYSAAIGELNRRILKFNLSAPAPQVQRMPYDTQPPAEP